MTKYLNKVIARLIVFGVSGSVILICTSELLRFVLSSNATEIPSTLLAQSLPSVNGNCNAVGQNNSACNTVVAPNRLSLSNELANELLNKMPIKKTVHLTTVGSSKDQNVGDDIQSFLVQNGYKIDRSIIGMLIPPPDNKISLRETADAYNLLIAPSASQ
jgi:hypothetical protein